MVLKLCVKPLIIVSCLSELLHLLLQIIDLLFLSLNLLFKLAVLLLQIFIVKEADLLFICYGVVFLFQQFDCALQLLAVLIPVFVAHLTLDISEVKCGN